MASVCRPFGIEDYYIKHRSYSRWAKNELTRLIQKNGFKDPIDVIEAFADKMDKFAKTSRTREAEFAFSTARNMANDILDEVLADYMED